MHPAFLIERRARALDTINRVALRLAALGKIQLPDPPRGQQPDEQHRAIAQLQYAAAILEQIEAGIDLAEAEARADAERARVEAAKAKLGKKAR